MEKQNPFIKIGREESLSQKVESQIKDAIIKKVFLPGDKLPGEMELCEAFGVSRTAIREALRMLSARGLIEIRKGSGAYVTDFSMSNFVDPLNQFLEMKCGRASHLYLVQVRRFIEPEIAKIAAERCTEEDINFLKKNLSEMEDSFHNSEKMIKIDIKFHRKLVNVSGNPLIPIILEPILQLLPKFISSTYKQDRAPDLAIEYHRKILDSIIRHDGNAAYEAMKTHMQLAEEHVLQYYKSIGFTDY